jgi:hypothetical protein
MHLAASHFEKILCPANRFCLCDLVSEGIGPGSEPFMDSMIPEFYHSTVVPSSKPHAETLRQNLGIFC